MDPPRSEEGGVVVRLDDSVLSAATSRALQDAGFPVVTGTGRGRICLSDDLDDPGAMVLVVPAIPAACAGARSRVVSGSALGAATEAEVDLVPTVVRSVAGGVVALTPGVLRLADQMPSLSPREMAVLELVAAGISLGQIARHLHVSHATVKRAVASLFAAVGVGTRVELVLVARRLGLLEQ